MQHKGGEKRIALLQLWLFLGSLFSPWMYAQEEIIGNAATKQLETPRLESGDASAPLTQDERKQLEQQLNEEIKKKVKDAQILLSDAPPDIIKDNIKVAGNDLTYEYKGKKITKLLEAGAKYAVTFTADGLPEIAITRSKESKVISIQDEKMTKDDKKEVSSIKEGKKKTTVEVDTKEQVNINPTREGVDKITFDKVPEKPEDVIIKKAEKGTLIHFPVTDENGALRVDEKGNPAPMEIELTKDADEQNALQFTREKDGVRFNKGKISANVDGIHFEGDITGYLTVKKITGAMPTGEKVSALRFGGDGYSVLIGNEWYTEPLDGHASSVERLYAETPYAQRQAQREILYKIRTETVPQLDAAVRTGEFGKAMKIAKSIKVPEISQNLQQVVQDYSKRATAIVEANKGTLDAIANARKIAKDITNEGIKTELETSFKKREDLLNAEPTLIQNVVEMTDRLARQPERIKDINEQLDTLKKIKEIDSSVAELRAYENIDGKSRASEIASLEAEQQGLRAGIKWANTRETEEERQQALQQVLAYEKSISEQRDNAFGQLSKAGRERVLAGVMKNSGESASGATEAENKRYWWDTILNTADEKDFQQKKVLKQGYERQLNDLRISADIQDSFEKKVQDKEAAFQRPLTQDELSDTHAESMSGFYQDKKNSLGVKLSQATDDATRNSIRSELDAIRDSSLAANQHLLQTIKDREIQQKVLQNYRNDLGESGLAQSLREVGNTKEMQNKGLYAGFWDYDMVRKGGGLELSNTNIDRRATDSIYNAQLIKNLNDELTKAGNKVSFNDIMDVGKAPSAERATVLQKKLTESGITMTPAERSAAVSAASIAAETYAVGTFSEGMVKAATDRRTIYDTYQEDKWLQAANRFFSPVGIAETGVTLGAGVAAGMATKLVGAGLQGARVLAYGEETAKAIEATRAVGAVDGLAKLVTEGAAFEYAQRAGNAALYQATGGKMGEPYHAPNAADIAWSIATLGAVHTAGRATGEVFGRMFSNADDVINLASAEKQIVGLTGRVKQEATSALETLKTTTSAAERYTALNTLTQYTGMGSLTARGAAIYTAGTVGGVLAETVGFTSVSGVRRAYGEGRKVELSDVFNPVEVAHGLATVGGLRLGGRIAEPVVGPVTRLVQRGTEYIMDKAANFAENRALTKAHDSVFTSSGKLTNLIERAANALSGGEKAEFYALVKTGEFTGANMLLKEATERAQPQARAPLEAARTAISELDIKTAQKIVREAKTGVTTALEKTQNTITPEVREKDNQRISAQERLIHAQEAAGKIGGNELDYQLTKLENERAVHRVDDAESAYRAAAEKEWEAQAIFEREKTDVAKRSLDQATEQASAARQKLAEEELTGMSATEKLTALEYETGRIGTKTKEITDLEIKARRALAEQEQALREAQELNARTAAIETIPGFRRTAEQRLDLRDISVKEAAAKARAADKVREAVKAKQELIEKLIDDATKEGNRKLAETLEKQRMFILKEAEIPPMLAKEAELARQITAKERETETAPPEQKTLRQEEKDSLQHEQEKLRQEIVLAQKDAVDTALNVDLVSENAHRARQFELDRALRSTLEKESQRYTPENIGKEIEAEQQRIYEEKKAEYEKAGLEKEKAGALARVDAKEAPSIVRERKASVESKIKELKARTTAVEAAVAAPAIIDALAAKDVAVSDKARLEVTEEGKKKGLDVSVKKINDLLDSLDAIHTSLKQRMGTLEPGKTAALRKTQVEPLLQSLSGNKLIEAAAGLGKTSKIIPYAVVMLKQIYGKKAVLLLPDKASIDKFKLEVGEKYEFFKGAGLKIEEFNRNNPRGDADVIITTPEMFFEYIRDEAASKRFIRDITGATIIADEAQLTIPLINRYSITRGRQIAIEDLAVGQEAIAAQMRADAILEKVAQENGIQKKDLIGRDEKGTPEFKEEYRNVVYRELVKESESYKRLSAAEKAKIDALDGKELENRVKDLILKEGVESPYSDTNAMLNIYKRIALQTIGTDYGYNAKEGIVTPRERQHETGKRFQSVHEVVGYETWGREFLRKGFDVPKEVDFKKVGVSDNSAETTALEVLSKVFGQVIGFTGTPGTLSTAFRTILGVKTIFAGSEKLVTEGDAKFKGIRNLKTLEDMVDAKERDATIINTATRLSDVDLAARVRELYKGSDAEIVFISPGEGRLRRVRIDKNGREAVVKKYGGFDELDNDLKSMYNQNGERVNGPERFIKYYEKGMDVGTDLPISSKEKVRVITDEGSTLTDVVQGALRDRGNNARTKDQFSQFAEHELLVFGATKEHTLDSLFAKDGLFMKNEHAEKQRQTLEGIEVAYRNIVTDTIRRIGEIERGRMGLEEAPLEVAKLLQEWESRAGKDLSVDNSYRDAREHLAERISQAQKFVNDLLTDSKYEDFRKSLSKDSLDLLREQTGDLLNPGEFAAKFKEGEMDKPLIEGVAKAKTLREAADATLATVGRGDIPETTLGKTGPLVTITAEAAATAKPLSVPEIAMQAAKALENVLSLQKNLEARAMRTPEEQVELAQLPASIRTAEENVRAAMGEKGISLARQRTELSALIAPLAVLPTPTPAQQDELNSLRAQIAATDKQIEQIIASIPIEKPEEEIPVQLQTLIKAKDILKQQLPGRSEQEYNKLIAAAYKATGSPLAEEIAKAAAVRALTALEGVAIQEEALTAGIKRDIAASRTKIIPFVAKALERQPTEAELDEFERHVADFRPCSRCAFGADLARKFREHLITKYPAAKRMAEQDVIDLLKTVQGPSSLVALGLEYFNYGLYAEAKTKFEDYLASGETAYRNAVFQYLAEMSFRLHDYSGAKAYAQEALKSGELTSSQQAALTRFSAEMDTKPEAVSRLKKEYEEGKKSLDEVVMELYTKVKPASLDPSDSNDLLGIQEEPDAVSKAVGAIAQPGFINTILYDTGGLIEMYHAGRFLDELAALKKQGITMGVTDAVIKELERQRDDDRKEEYEPGKFRALAPYDLTNKIYEAIGNGLLDRVSKKPDAGREKTIRIAQQSSALNPSRNIRVGAGDIQTMHNAIEGSAPGIGYAMVVASDTDLQYIANSLKPFNPNIIVLSPHQYKSVVDELQKEAKAKEEGIVAERITAGFNLQDRRKAVQDSSTGTATTDQTTKCSSCSLFRGSLNQHYKTINDATAVLQNPATTQEQKTDAEKKITKAFDDIKNLLQDHIRENQVQQQTAEAEYAATRYDNVINGLPIGTTAPPTRADTIQEINDALSAIDDRMPLVTDKKSYAALKDMRTALLGLTILPFSAKEEFTNKRVLALGERLEWPQYLRTQYGTRTTIVTVDPKVQQIEGIPVLQQDYFAPFAVGEHDVVTLNFPDYERKTEAGMETLADNIAGSLAAGGRFYLVSEQGLSSKIIVDALKRKGLVVEIDGLNAADSVHGYVPDPSKGRETKEGILEFPLTKARVWVLQKPMPEALAEEKPSAQEIVKYALENKLLKERKCGGYGCVYNILYMGKEYAIKTPFSAKDKVSVDSIKLEAEKYKWLEYFRYAHPEFDKFLPKHYGSYTSRDTPYLVIEYVAGQQLSEIRWSDYTKQDTLDEFSKFIDELGKSPYKLKHGDISPYNILVRLDGTPVLIDWGRPQPTNDRAALDWVIRTYYIKAESEKDETVAVAGELNLQNDKILGMFYDNRVTIVNDKGQGRLSTTETYTEENIEGVMAWMNSRVGKPYQTQEEFLATGDYDSVLENFLHDFTGYRKAYANNRPRIAKEIIVKYYTALKMIAKFGKMQGVDVSAYVEFADRYKPFVNTYEKFMAQKHPQFSGLLGERGALAQFTKNRIKQWAGENKIDPNELDFDIQPLKRQEVDNEQVLEDAQRKEVELSIFQMLFGKKETETPETREIKSLIEQLGSQDADERIKAIAELSKRDSVPFLIKALEHQNKDVRENAARTLGEMKAAESVPSLIRTLKDSDVHVKGRVIYALSKIGTLAIPELIKALRDDSLHSSLSDIFGLIGNSAVQPLIDAYASGDRITRWGIVISLGNIRSSKAIPVLVDALDDPFTKKFAILALGKIGEDAQRIVPALVKLANDASVRSYVIAALGMIRGREAVPVLAEALNDPDEGIKFEAGRGLVFIGEDAVPALIPMLETSPAEIRERVLEILQVIGPKAKSAVPSITKLLKDKGLRVRKLASNALGAIGSPEAVPALLEALGDDSITSYVEFSLKRIPLPDEAVFTLVKYITPENKILLRTSAMRLLGKIGPKAAIAVQILIDSLNEENQQLKVTATITLSAIGESALPGLLIAANNDVWEIRNDAIRAIGNIGQKAKSAIPLLITRLADSDIYVSENAQTALIKVASPEQLLDIIIKEKKPQLAKRAIERLALTRPSSFTPEILKQLTDLYGYLPEFKFAVSHLTKRTGITAGNLERLLVTTLPQGTLEERVEKIVKQGKKKVLFVNNIKDGLGDELTRTGTMLEALLAANPEVEITLYTARPFLYDHPRINTRTDFEKIGDPTQFDIVINHFDERQFYSAKAEDTIMNLESRLGGRNHIYIGASKGIDPTKYEQLRVDEFVIPLFTHRVNAYEHTYRLLAMLGMAFKVGEERRVSIFTTIPSPESEQWWVDEIQKINKKNRPVAVFNGVGGESSRKGFETPTRYSSIVTDLIKRGYFVVLLPNHQPWGTTEIVKELAADVPAEVTQYMTIAPEPTAQTDTELWKTKLHKYLLAKSDLVVTVEGGAMHFAYNMGKPLIAIKMSGSGEFEKWLSYALSEKQRSLENINEFRETLDSVWRQELRKTDADNEIQKLIEQAKKCGGGITGAATCPVAVMLKLQEAVDAENINDKIKLLGEAKEILIKEPERISLAEAAKALTPEDIDGVIARLRTQQEQSPLEQLVQRIEVPAKLGEITTPTITAHIDALYGESPVDLIAALLKITNQINKLSPEQQELVRDRAKHLVSHWHPAVAAQAIKLLAIIGNPEDFPAVLQFIKNDEKIIRRPIFSEGERRLGMEAYAIEHNKAVVTGLRNLAAFGRVAVPEIRKRITAPAVQEGIIRWIIGGVFERQFDPELGSAIWQNEQGFRDWIENDPQNAALLLFDEYSVEEIMKLPKNERPEIIKKIKQELTATRLSHTTYIEITERNTKGYAEQKKGEALEFVRAKELKLKRMTTLLRELGEKEAEELQEAEKALEEEAIKRLPAKEVASEEMQALLEQNPEEADETALIALGKLREELQLLTVLPEEIAPAIVTVKPVLATRFEDETTMEVANHIGKVMSLGISSIVGVSTGSYMLWFGSLIGLGKEILSFGDSGVELLTRMISDPTQRRLVESKLAAVEELLGIPPEKALNRGVPFENLYAVARQVHKFRAELSDERIATRLKELYNAGIFVWQIEQFEGMWVFPDIEQAIIIAESEFPLEYAKAFWNKGATIHEITELSNRYKTTEGQVTVDLMYNLLPKIEKFGMVEYNTLEKNVIRGEIDIIGNAILPAVEQNAKENIPLLPGMTPKQAEELIQEKRCQSPCKDRNEFMAELAKAAGLARSEEDIRREGKIPYGLPNGVYVTKETHDFLQKVVDVKFFESLLEYIDPAHGAYDKAKEALELAEKERKVKTALQKAVAELAKAGVALSDEHVIPARDAIRKALREITTIPEVNKLLEETIEKKSRRELKPIDMNSEEPVTLKDGKYIADRRAERDKHFVDSSSEDKYNALLKKTQLNPAEKEEFERLKMLFELREMLKPQLVIDEEDIPYFLTKKGMKSLRSGKEVTISDAYLSADIFTGDTLPQPLSMLVFLDPSIYTPESLEIIITARDKTSNYVEHLRRFHMARHIIGANAGAIEKFLNKYDQLRDFWVGNIPEDTAELAKLYERINEFNDDFRTFRWEVAAQKNPLRDVNGIRKTLNILGIAEPEVVTREEGIGEKIETKPEEKKEEVTPEEKKAVSITPEHLITAAGGLSAIINGNNKFAQGSGGTIYRFSVGSKTYVLKVPGEKWQEELLGVEAGQYEALERFRKAYPEYSRFVPEYYGLHKKEGKPYLLLEYVDAQALGEIDGKWAEHTTQQQLEEFKRFLDVMNSFNIKHGDMDFGNLLVRPDGNMVLIDFGDLWKGLRTDKEKFEEVIKMLYHPAKKEPSASGKLQMSPIATIAAAAAVLIHPIAGVGIMAVYAAYQARDIANNIINWFMAESPEQQEMQALINQLKEPEHKAAAQRLFAMGTKAVPSLINALRNQDGDIRSAATNLLENMGDTSLPFLVSALKNNDADIRKYAAHIIRRMSPIDKKFIPQLIDALSDSDFDVGYDSALKLSEMRDDAVPALIKTIKKGNFDSKRNALIALSYMDSVPSDAVPILIKVLQTERGSWKGYATTALGKSRLFTSDQRVILALRKALRSDDNNARAEAAKALGKFGDTASLPKILGLFNDPSMDVRASAVEAAGMLVKHEGVDTTAAVAALITLLKNPSLVAKAAAALGNMGTKAAPATHSLIEALHSEYLYSEVQKEIIIALGKIGNEEALTVLLAIAKDKDRLQYIKVNAVDAIGIIGPNANAAIPELIELIKTIEWNIGVHAVKALAKIGKKSLPALLELIRHNPNVIVISNVEETAADLLAKTDIEEILELLKDSNHRIRKIAAMAIQKAKPTDPRIASVLVNTLIGSSHEDRSQIERALELMGEAALPELVNALTIDDDRVLTPAVNLLTKAGTKALPFIIPALENENVITRRMAATILGNLGDDSAPAVDSLLKAIRDDDKSVRSFAANALEKITSKKEKIVADLLTQLKRRTLPKDILWIFGNMKIAEAVPEFIIALGETDLREDAVQALGNLGAAAIPALIDTLEKEKDIDIRLSVMHALRIIRYDEREVNTAVPALIRALKDPLPEIVIEAGKTLGDIGEPALPALGEVIRNRALMPQTKAVALETVLHIAAGLTAVPDSMKELLWQISVDTTEDMEMKDKATHALFEAADALFIARKLQIDYKLADYVSSRKVPFMRLLENPAYKETMNAISSQLGKERTSHPSETRMGDIEKMEVFDFLFSLEIEQLEHAKEIFDQYFRNDPQQYAVDLGLIATLISHTGLEGLQRLAELIKEDPQHTIEEIYNIAEKNLAAMPEADREFVKRKLQWIIENHRMLEEELKQIEQLVRGLDKEAAVSLLESIEKANTPDALVSIGKPITDIFQIKLSGMPRNELPGFIIKTLTSLDSIKIAGKTRLSEAQKTSVINVVADAMRTMPEEEQRKVIFGILFKLGKNKEDIVQFIAKPEKGPSLLHQFVEGFGDTLKDNDVQRIVTADTLTADQKITVLTQLSKGEPIDQIIKKLPKDGGALKDTLVRLGEKLVMPSIAAAKIPHVFFSPLLYITALDASVVSSVMPAFHKVITAEPVRRTGILKNTLYDNLAEFKQKSYPDAPQMLKAIMTTVQKEFNDFQDINKKGREAAERLRQRIEQIMLVKDARYKAMEMRFTDANGMILEGTNERIRELGRTIEKDMLEKATFNAKAYEELQTILSTIKINSLLATFEKKTDISDREAVMAKLVKYKESDSGRQKDYQGRDLYALIQTYVGTKEQPVFYKEMYEALLNEVDGKFSQWRYTSSDYLATLNQFIETGIKQKGLEENFAEVKGENSLEKIANSEYGGGYADIKQALTMVRNWEKPIIRTVMLPDGKEYTLEFADDMFTLMNLGNSPFFFSCQNCISGGYNAGLLGYITNGANKALVTKNKEGVIVSRMIARLRFVDGRLMIVLERVYGTIGAKQLEELAKDVSMITGLPVAKSGTEQHALTLFAGRSPYDYSDIYGRQLEGGGAGLYNHEEHNSAKNLGKTAPIVVNVEVTIEEPPKPEMPAKSPVTEKITAIPLDEIIHATQVAEAAG